LSHPHDSEDGHVPFHGVSNHKNISLIFTLLPPAMLVHSL
jgi:hypothetical protein